MTEVQGYNGSVAFDGTYITIRRKGLIARSTVGRGDKRIPIAAVVSVQFKPATSLFTGFIQFETAGQGGTRSRAGRQTQDALQDENSVVFHKKALAGFEALRAEIEAALAAHHAPLAGPAQPAVPVSLADELGKLSDLLRQGLLAPHEFEAAKARLLGQ